MDMCICWHKCKEMHAFHTQILERRNVNWITCCHAGLVYLAHRGGHQRLLDSHDIPDDSTLSSSKHRKTYGNPQVTCEMNLHSWCVCVCEIMSYQFTEEWPPKKIDTADTVSFITMSVPCYFSIFWGLLSSWRYFMGKFGYDEDISRNAE